MTTPTRLKTSQAGLVVVVVMARLESEGEPPLDLGDMVLS